MEKASVIASFKKFSINFKVINQEINLQKITTGFLHDSYCLTYKPNRKKYILQKLSPIFNLKAININLKLFEQAQIESHQFLPKYWQRVHYFDVLNSQSKIYFDPVGNAWRVMNYVTGEIFDNFHQVPKGKKEEIAYSLGQAIAIFGKILSIIPRDKWRKPLPNFHNPLYHYKYLHSILDNKKVVLSLSQDSDLKVSLKKEILGRYSRRIDLLLKKIKKRKKLITGLNDLGWAITHGDLKINNAVFRQDQKGKWHCITLIDLDTIQSGGVLDDLGDALRSAGNPAGEHPASLDLVQIDKTIVNNLIDGFLGEISQFYGQKKAFQLRRYVFKAFAQFLYIQGIRFLADALVGNCYFKLQPGEPSDLNLYRAEVQIKALEKLEEGFHI